MRNKIQIISAPGTNRAEAESMLGARGWNTDVDPEAFFFLHDLAPDAFFVMRGWRDDPDTESKVREVMESGVKTYWEPNPPPKLNCPDFAALSAVNWQNVTSPTDERKGRTRFQTGCDVAEAHPIVETARRCGHKMTVKMSQYNPSVLVLTIHADRRRTFHLKMWTSNETQARNVMEELSALELESMT